MQHNEQQGGQSQGQGGGQNQGQGGGGGAGGDEHKVAVAIGTTSGFYPETGFNEVPVNQKVQVELAKAAAALKLTSTAGWIVTVTTPSGVRTIDPSRSYADNQLAGEVTLDWGPSEGGGGACDASGRI